MGIGFIAQGVQPSDKSDEWDGERVGRKAHGKQDTKMLKTDSSCCMAETNTSLSRNHPSIKNKIIFYILKKKRHENVHEDIKRRAFVFVRGKNKNHLNTHQLGTGLISHGASTCWTDCKPHKDRADIRSINTIH